MKEAEMSDQSADRDAEDGLPTLWRKELVALQERMEQLEDARNTQKALRAADAEKHRVSVEALKSRIIDLKMAVGDDADRWFKRYREAEEQRNVAWAEIERLKKALEDRWAECHDGSESACSKSHE